MAVPVWVWANSAFFAAAGVYLWWRLVAQTTMPGTAVRQIGTAFFAVVAVLAPLGLLSQFLMPISFQRIVGWPAWVGYAFVIFTGCTALLVEPFRLVWWWRRRRPERSVGRSVGTVGADTPPDTLAGGVSRRVALDVVSPWAFSLSGRL